MTLQCFSTAALPPGLQFADWRESICQAFAALDPVPQAARGQPFPGLVEVDALPGAHLSLVQSQAQRVLRAPPQIRSDPRERLVVNLMLRGTGQVEQDGQRSLVAAGDVYVVDTARPYMLQHTQPFSLLCLSLPADGCADALALARGWLGRVLAMPGAAPAAPAPPLQDLWRRAMRLIGAELPDPAL